MELYAVDCTLISPGVNVDYRIVKINQYLATSSVSLKEWRLLSSKSTVSLFTSCTKKVKFTLEISGDERFTIQNLKILEVVFDSLLHMLITSVLKVLAGTTWSIIKKIIVRRYKAIGRSFLNYAALVWTLFLCDTKWWGLQKAENNAYRITTGCVMMTNVDHLQEESGILLVRQHNMLLTRLFLMASHQHILMEDHFPDASGRISAPIIQTFRT